MMAGMITLILTGLLRGVRNQRFLVFENLALRHQLAVLQRTASRPRLRTSDRLFWVLLSRLWSGWTDAVSVVQPATVIRWQRTGFTLFWKWRSRRNGPGRPAVAPEVRGLIRRMSTANPFGARRGFTVGSRTGAVPVGSPWLCPPFPASCPCRFAMSPSPAPARSNGANGFLVRRSPADFASRVMGPIVLGAFSRTAP